VLAGDPLFLAALARRYPLSLLYDIVAKLAFWTGSCRTLYVVENDTHRLIYLYFVRVLNTVETWHGGICDTCQAKYYADGEDAFAMRRSLASIRAESGRFPDDEDVKALKALEGGDSAATAEDGGAEKGDAASAKESSGGE
jgi:hypothetical protein